MVPVKSRIVLSNSASTGGTDNDNFVGVQGKNQFPVQRPHELIPGDDEPIYHRKQPKLPYKSPYAQESLGLRKGSKDSQGS